ncbi:Rad4 beta-hairpin domain 3-domain-containing protein, partial [Scheffersomyces amazonensis]|uniref:Rad4 beta-hairpin domain 3-domain-containing protein n=1 Tax=Scheffersomyces amazonensis TaxID=1078765 RepID=UPI00315C4FCA
MVSYMLHARNRNKWLSNKKVLKTLKHLLPKEFIKKHVRVLQRTLDEKSPLEFNEESDKQLIYILKYLIKWFRLNFKFKSNGLRVLGYLPKNKPPDQYYPNNATKLENINDFIRVIKKFAHNRDTGAQIFTAILRSLGFEARLVFSLPLLAVNDVSLKQPKLDFHKLDINKDNDLLYPYYWTELINPLDTNEVIVIETECFHNEDHRLIRLKRIFNDTIDEHNLNRFYTDLFYPISNQFNQMSMHYVIGLSNDNLILPISSRYMPDISYRWFNKLDLRTDYGRSTLLFQSLIRIFNGNRHYDHLTDLELSTLRKVAMINYKIPHNITAMKRNPNVVTISTLRYNESIDVKTTKAIKKILLDTKKESVYFKNNIVVGKSVNQWKFLGRSVIPEEIERPIKTTKALTPRTIEGKRIFNLNIQNNQPELNETRLYSFAQTCSYICDEVKSDNGNLILPRNKYGNIEIYRPCMIPRNCVWLKLSNLEAFLSSYNKSNIEMVHYVPVVVGFNFSTKPGQCIPVKQGVLILKDEENRVKKIWLNEKMKASHLEFKAKRQHEASMWRIFIRKLRIKRRLEKQYG